MKRTWLNSLFLLMIFAAFSLSVSAQEEKKKEVNRIKIVTVDEDGNKVIIDTTLSDLEGIKAYKTKDGKFIGLLLDDDNQVTLLDNNDGEVSWTMIRTDGDSLEVNENIQVIKGGKVIVHTDKESDDTEKTMSWTAKKGDNETVYVFSNDNSKNSWVSEEEDDDDEMDLKEGEKKIIIKSDGEVDEYIIKGDAVITIKDGKVSVKGGSGDEEEKYSTEQKEIVVKKKKKNS